MRPHRALVVLLALSALTAAWADHLVFIPTGTKVAENGLHFDGFVWGNSLERYQSVLDYGLGNSFEVELESERLDSGKAVGSMGFAYNYLVPVPDLTPGVSIGVRDIFETTKIGRSVYVATTFRSSVDLPGVRSSLELTLGAGVGGIHGGFVGVMIPFADQVRLVAEHDSRNITAGFELQPVKGITINLLYQQSATIVGLGYQRRF